MRDFLLSYSQYIMMAVFVIEVLTVLGLFSALFKVRKMVVFITILLVLGLCFDSGMIAAGRFIGDGELLQTLSRYRYLAHGVLVPLMVVISMYALEPTRGGKLLAWGLGFLLMAAGAAMGWFTEIEKVEIANMLRYSSSAATAVWARIIGISLPIIGVVVMFLCGLAVLVKQKRISLLFAAVIALVPHIVAPATGNLDLAFVFSAVGEMLMALFLLGYCDGIKKEE